jgi:hypothetical protein
VLGNDLRRERIVTHERGIHRLGMLLPEAGAALDVREKEGHRAGRQRCDIAHQRLARRANGLPDTEWAAQASRRGVRSQDRSQIRYENGTPRPRTASQDYR